MGSAGQGELIALLLPPGSPSSVTPILLHITYWVDTYRRVRCRSRCNPWSHNFGGSDRERTSIHVVRSLSDFESNKTAHSLVAVWPGERRGRSEARQVGLQAFNPACRKRSPARPSVAAVCHLRER